MGTGGSFPRVKRVRSVTLTTHPHLLPRSRIIRSHIVSPCCRLRGVAGQLYFIFIYYLSSDIVIAIIKLEYIFSAVAIRFAAAGSDTTCFRSVTWQFAVSALDRGEVLTVSEVSGSHGGEYEDDCLL
jgi:hypothetical protein